MTKRQVSVLVIQTRALQRRLRRVTPFGAAQFTTAIGELVELRRLAGRRKPKKLKAKRKAKRKVATRGRSAHAKVLTAIRATNDLRLQVVGGRQGTRLSWARAAGAK